MTLLNPSPVEADILERVAEARQFLQSEFDHRVGILNDIAALVNSGRSETANDLIEAGFDAAKAGLE